MNPRIGEVYLARLDPVLGSEQGGIRRVAVLQTADLYQFTSTVLCVPLTSSFTALGLPGTCVIDKGEAGSDRNALALAFQLRALDRTRLIKRYGVLSQTAIDAIAYAAVAALGIETVH